MEIALIYEKILTVYKTTSLPSVYSSHNRIVRPCRPVCYLFQQQLTAAWAFLSRRLLPYHEITFRIIDTAVISSALLGLLHNNIFAALGTCHANLLEIRLGVAALRESGACQKSAVRSVFDHHASAAQFTDFVGFFIRDRHLCQIFLSFFTAASRSG